MMTEMQMGMVLLGAALIEVNGCLFAFDGKNDGKYMYFAQVDGCRKIALKCKALISENIKFVR